MSQPSGSSEPIHPSPSPQALYYPFHLCHEKTLRRLLEDYASVHFRDYMALQLTPLHGTTAYPDRMGERFPHLLREGRIVQGYNVSGPLDGDLSSAVDRDLADPVWRQRFHLALSEDRRFQRGLFGTAHAVQIGGTAVPGPAALLRLLDQARQAEPWSVTALRELAGRATTPEDGFRYEYGLALVKTSASLRHTIRLAHQHHLVAVTDSPPHFDLLVRSCQRERVALQNHLVAREGY